MSALHPYDPHNPFGQRTAFATYADDELLGLVNEWLVMCVMIGLSQGRGWEIIRIADSIEVRFRPPL